MATKVKVVFSNAYETVSPYFDMAYGAVTPKTECERLEWNEMYKHAKEGIRKVVARFGSVGSDSKSDFSMNAEALLDHRIYVLIYNHELISQDIIFSIWSFLPELMDDKFAVLIDASGDPVDLYCCILKDKILQYSQDSGVLRMLKDDLSASRWSSVAEISRGMGVDTFS